MFQIIIVKATHKQVSCFFLPPPPEKTTKNFLRNYAKLLDKPTKGRGKIDYRIKGVSIKPHISLKYGQYGNKSLKTALMQAKQSGFNWFKCPYGKVIL